MLAVPVGPAWLVPSLCNRRIPVFDGAVRADLVLARGAVVTAITSPHRDPALNCRIGWIPAAGHSATDSSVRRRAENDDLCVRLAPIPGGRPLPPLILAAGTGWETARIEATGGRPTGRRLCQEWLTIGP